MHGAERTTTTEMISATPTPQAAQPCERPALFFSLDDHMRILGLHGHEIQFAGRTINGDFMAIGEILPVQCREVTDALRASCEGRPARARCNMESNGRVFHCELHCFPDLNGLEKSISCFLIDRTAEEEDAAALQRKIYELDIINQTVRAFAETRNLSDILRIILLGVTAGPGLGFNRGFVLLSNESRSFLWGCLATGPSTPEEAGIIWQDLARRSLTLEEILRLYKSTGQNAEDSQVNKLVASLKIPLSDESNFIVKAVKVGHSIVAGPEMMQGESNQELIRKFGIDSMAVVPLTCRESLQGVLLADNMITRKPILPSDLKILEIYARYASDAIENSRLYGKLEQQICRLEEANEKIIRSRENLVKAEKLSSVAKMALDVAHEIRNPLTVIGGFANAQLRKINPDDPSRKVLDIVSKQVSRIEGALDRFSSVVSLSEKKEGRFSLANLVRETLGTLAASASPDLPTLVADDDAELLEVFVDQGLFYQAMMVILRKAAQITGSMLKLGVRIARKGDSGLIFIMSADEYPKFAEEFYRLLRVSKGDLKHQEMAVALEILQHYGGGIGVLSEENGPVQLFVELPLCKEA
jgi:GAF domain-containing protein